MVIPDSSQRPVRATAQRTPVPTDFGPRRNTDTEIAAPFRIRPPHAPGRYDAAHTSANGSAATSSSPGISTKNQRPLLTTTGLLMEVRCNEVLAGAFLWLRSRNAAEQTLDTEVFVDLGPVNALAVTEQLPVSALGLRRGEQARKPDQGHTDSRPSVRPTTSSDAVKCTEPACDVRLASEVLMPRSG